MAKTKEVTAVKVSSVQEATARLQEIGSTERKITGINKKLNDRIDKLKAAAIKVAQPLSDRTLELVEGLYEFAEANRAELTEGDKTKTITLPTGTLAWKKTPPAVHLKKVAEVIAAIKKLGLGKKFLRTADPEVDKNAMLKEPELAKKITGVTITQDEQFIVKPSESNAEITKTLKPK